MSLPVTQERTATPERGTRPIRIGNSSGFYGDRDDALVEMVALGDIDVITGDYLAEVTMLILGKSRQKDPTTGYATTFMRHLEPALDQLAANGTKLIVNAGGLNPAGLAQATRELVSRHGLDLAVSHVEGDNIEEQLVSLQQAGHRLGHLRTGEPLSEWEHSPITANAYLGGFGITRALANGADIVITGRVADASLVVGAAAWWWDWAREDFDALAGAVAAGHVIECGPQATGGNFSDFGSIAHLDRPGYPIAEVDKDGSAIITKPAGTDGAVTTDTVTAQLLYEIGGPAYLNADVTTLMDSVRLSVAGEDRIRIEPVRGTPPPATTKVAITGLGGWETTNILALTGGQQERKAALLERALRATGAADALDELIFERIGVAAQDASSQSEATSFLRVTARGTRETAGRSFSSRLVSLTLANYPGMYFLAPPQAGSNYGVYRPGVINQEALDHRVVHHDGTVEHIPALAGRAATANEADSAGHRAQGTEGTEGPTSLVLGDVPSLDVPLGDIALARSGDKGGDANVGIWVRSDEAWEWLRSYLTEAELPKLLPETGGLTVQRHEFPNLRGINFLIHDLLGSGATSSLRLDRQAKALGEWLLSRTVRVPVSLLNGPGPSSEPELGR
jgi:hypothetical protein